MKNIVPRCLLNLIACGNGIQVQESRISTLGPILEKIWTTRNLYMHNSIQFGPKRDFGPFLTEGSYQSFHNLWSNIMFFILPTNIYQAQAEDKYHRCKNIRDPWNPDEATPTRKMDHFSIFQKQLWFKYQCSTGCFNSLIIWMASLGIPFLSREWMSEGRAFIISGMR